MISSVESAPDIGEAEERQHEKGNSRIDAVTAERKDYRPGPLPGGSDRLPALSGDNL